MKIWKEFGSSHSADITIIGKFRSTQIPANAVEILEDFLNISDEYGLSDNDSEKIQALRDFYEKWKSTLFVAPFPNKHDIQLGIEENPNIRIESNQIIIRNFGTGEVAGLIKLLHNLKADYITIDGSGIV